MSAITITQVNNCDPICSEDFSCDWSRWNNEFKYKFSDGTYQTCIGAQVRCECTLMMSIASLFTYEHPSAVTLPILCILLIVSILGLRCFLLWICTCCSKEAALPYLYRNDIDDTHGESEGDNISSQNMDIPSMQIKSRNSTRSRSPPPPYSTIFMHDEILSSEEPPPKYSECMKN